MRKLVVDCKDAREKRLRLVKTGCMGLIWLCIGAATAIFEPTVIDLRDSLNCDYEQLTRTFFAKGIGMMAGSLMGGYLADRFRPYIDWLLSAELLILGGSLAAVPWSNSLGVLAFVQSVTGISHGALSAGGNSLVLAMWSEGPSAALQVVHAFYGISITVIPFVAIPFLSQYITANQTVPISNLSLPLSQLKTASRIYIPYAICGGLCVISAAVMFTFVFYKLHSIQRSAVTKRSFKQLFSAESCAKGDCCLGSSMLALLFLTYFTIVAKDTSLLTLLVPIAVHTHLNFTKNEAVILVAVFSIACTLGRILTALLSKCINNYILLMIEIIVNIAVVALMCVPVLQTSTFYWLFIAIYGLFTGPIFPAVMVWASQYIELTGVAVAIIDFGVGFGASLSSWLAGYIFQFMGPFFVIYLCLIFCVILLFLLVAGKALICYRTPSKVEDEQTKLLLDGD